MTLPDEQIRIAFDTPAAEEAPPALPYRTEIRNATPAELDRRNKAEGRKRAARFLEPWEASNQARHAQSAVDARIESWINHPDERVPEALADNRDLIGNRDDFRKALCRRAIQDAEAEGLVWTPLLDAIVDNGVWPGGHTYDSSTRQWVEVPAGETTPGDMTKRLIAWAAEETNPRNIEPLVPMRSSHVRQSILAAVPVIDVPLAEAVSHGDAWDLSQLAANPALPGDVVDWLHRWAERRLTDLARKDSWDYQVESHTTAVIHALERSGHATPRALVDTVARLARELHQQEKNGGEHLARMVVNLHTTTTAADLMAVSDILDSKWARETLLKHERADVEVLKKVLGEGTSFADLRETLAWNPKARLDPEIRADLLKSSVAAVMEGLLADVADDNPRVFKRYARKFPIYAVTVLEQGEIAGAAALDQEWAFRFAMEHLERQAPGHVVGVLKDDKHPGLEGFDRVGALQGAVAQLNQVRALDAVQAFEDEKLDELMEQAFPDRLAAYRETFRCAADQAPSQILSYLERAPGGWRFLPQLDHKDEFLYAFRSLAEKEPHRLNWHRRNLPDEWWAALRPEHWAPLLDDEAKHGAVEVLREIPQALELREVREHLYRKAFYEVVLDLAVDRAPDEQGVAFVAMAGQYGPEATQKLLADDRFDWDAAITPSTLLPRFQKSQAYRGLETLELIVDRFPDVLQSNEIHDTVLEYPFWRTISVFATRGLPERAPELFRWLAEALPSHALKLLEDGSVIGRISAADLAPLLKSEDSQMRMRAMTALPKLRGKGPAVKQDMERGAPTA